MSTITTIATIATNAGFKNIPVKEITKKKLNRIMNYGDTYDSFINKLLDHYKGGMEQYGTDGTMETNVIHSSESNT